MPVAHVEQRGQRVEPQSPVGPLGHDDRREEGHEEQHQQQRGEQPPRPAGPERPQLDREGLAPLAHQQRGDEEPGQDEEGVDPHEPAVHVRDPAVEHHHGDDGAGPDPVESREVGQTSVRDRALVVLHRAHPSCIGSGRHRRKGVRGSDILSDSARRPGAPPTPSLEVSGARPGPWPRPFPGHRVPVRHRRSRRISWWLPFSGPGAAREPASLDREGVPRSG